MPVALDYQAPASFRTPAPAHVLTVLLASTVPLAFWLGVATWAARVALVVGHWPSYSHPDPKDVSLPFAPWSHLLNLVGPVLLAGVAGVTSRYINRRVSAHRRRRVTILISACIGLLGVGLVWGDPGGMLNWAAD